MTAKRRDVSDVHHLLRMIIHIVTSLFTHIYIYIHTILRNPDVFVIAMFLLTFVTRCSRSFEPPFMLVPSHVTIAWRDNVVRGADSNISVCVSQCFTEFRSKTSKTCSNNMQQQFAAKEKRINLRQLLCCQVTPMMSNRILLEN